MIYYIENSIIIWKSQTPIAYGDWIIKIEKETELINPIFENNDIIEYENSDKKVQDDLEKQEEIVEENEEVELSEIQLEKQNLESCWYIVEIIDWVCVTTETDESKKHEIKLKYDRIMEINWRLSYLWRASEIITTPWLDAKIDDEVIVLNTEKAWIETEITNNYVTSLVDDVLNVFFF